jgi:hypothetical protein
MLYGVEQRKCANFAKTETFTYGEINLSGRGSFFNLTDMAQPVLLVIAQRMLCFPRLAKAREARLLSVGCLLFEIKSDTDTKIQYNNNIPTPGGRVLIGVIANGPFRI